MPENLSRTDNFSATAVPQPLGVVNTAALFGGAALLLFAMTHGLLPAVHAATGIEPILLWFLLGGLGVFTPLIVIGVLMLWREGTTAGVVAWRDRLRFRRMDVGDWLWSLGTRAAVVGLAGASLAAVRVATGEAGLRPSFLRMEPLGPGRYWLLAAWLPFWALNILGEEFLWRGVVLPRQEAAFGRRAWLAHGVGWLLFHAAFGPAILLALWPTTFFLPYAVQRRRNSWVGVVVHAGLNGPGFVAVAFGVV